MEVRGVEFFNYIKTDKSNVYHTSLKASKNAFIEYLELIDNYNTYVSEDLSRFDEVFFLEQTSKLEDFLKDDSLKNAYDEFAEYLKALLDKIKSFDYSLTIVNNLFINLITFVFQIVVSTLDWDRFKELMDYLKNLLDLSKRDRDLDNLISDKNIDSIIISTPLELTLEQLTHLKNLINNSNLPFKDEYIYYIDSKGTSTTGEAMIYFLLNISMTINNHYSIYVNSNDLLNKLLLELLDYLKWLREGLLKDYEWLKALRDSLVAISDKKAVIADSYNNLAVIQQMAQGSQFDPNDSQGIIAKEQLQIINVKNESLINSGVFIDNTYEIEIASKEIQDNLDANNNSLNGNIKDLEDLNNLLEDKKDHLGEGSTNDEVQSSLENTNSTITDMKNNMNAIQSDLDKQTALIKEIERQAKDNPNLNPDLVDILQNRVSSMDNVAQDMSDKKSNSIMDFIKANETLMKILALIAVILASLNAFKDPFGFLRNLLNLLIAPIELLLLAINAVLCLLKALVCFIVGVIMWISKMFNMLLDFFNSEDKLDKAMELSKIKLDIAIDQSIRDIVNGFKRAFTFIFEDRVTEARPGLVAKLGEEKAESVIESYREYMNSKVSLLVATQSWTSMLWDVLVEYAEDLKASFINTYENAMSIFNVKTCSSLNSDWDLDFLLDLKNPFQFALPDFRIPKIDSKIIKCR